MKEGLHEPGRTFGLTHCMDSARAISLSANIQQVDAESGTFCGGCAALLNQRLSALGSEERGTETTESEP